MTLLKAIKWVDNWENDKAKLVTNKSEDDLIYKEDIPKIEIHRIKSLNKPTLKPFILDLAGITGVHNIVHTI